MIHELHEVFSVDIFHTAELVVRLVKHADHLNQSNSDLVEGRPLMEGGCLGCT